MTEILNVGAAVMLLCGFIITLIFFIYSISENEKFAQKRIIPVFFLLFVLFIFTLTVQIPDLIQMALILLFILFVFLVLIRFGNKTIEFKFQDEKYDERDIMFSRNELEPGTQKFEDYYKRNPDNKTKDEQFRVEPGLLKSNSTFYNSLLFNAANSVFSAVNLLHPSVEGKRSKNVENNLNEKEISDFIRNWAKKLGAHSVGFTLLKPHHIYSHVGRGVNYGNEVNLQHKYAIAFTVEMNHEYVQSAPKGTIILESAQQYFNAGQIAVQVAQFIRNLGKDARAHIDTNYQIICPTIAQDAGLGTIGRMGLLMTPKLGPRVRIGVITTNLNLEINKFPIDSTVIQFCKICKKCAVNCPSKAIPTHSVQVLEGWKPWKINQEKCFTYWTKVGTDCGKCVAVCPYSHPNNFIHNMVRWIIRRNSFNRRLALHLDNYFYGKKPSNKPLKPWMIKSK